MISRRSVLLLGISVASASNTSHYEKPPCQSDEVGVQVQGLEGETCAPKCQGMTCPTDVPAGTTAKPQCVLQDAASGDKYCALTCFAGGCPAGSTCRHAGIIGLCMYDKSNTDNSQPTELSGVAKQFEEFVEQFDKKYESPSQAMSSFNAFVENVGFIAEENAKESNTYKLDVNEFADMSLEEFKHAYMGYKLPSKKWGELPSLGMHRASNKTLPDSVDWTTKGAVTPVKNQGQCGSCWAFSTTGSLEGAWQLASGNLVSLSEQQLVDCASSFGEQGCNGGEMDSAFQYVKQNGLDTEESYSYRGRGGTCAASSGKAGIPAGAVTGYRDVTPNNMQAMMEAVAQQPVSIAIEADKMGFQLYRSGVLSGACGTSLDHGVLAVGYGAENGQNYWLVKNSWGSSWGISGYGKLLRGKDAQGECGILMQPSYPVVSSSPGPVPPAPPSPPPAPPAPPAPSTSHYEKPPCQSDEVDVQVQGLEGETCAPKCQGMACPTDVPAGTTAQPQCVLQDASTGDKYCALTCFLGKGCPAGSTCRHSGMIGLCMYDKSVESHPLEVVAIALSDGLITV